MVSRIALVWDENSTAFLAELTRRLTAFSELVEKPVELIEIIRDIPRGAAAIRPKSVPTGRAGEFRLILEPCDALLRLMPALRALDREGDFVAELGHVESSIGVVTTPMVGEGEEGVTVTLSSPVDSERLQ